MKLNWQVVAADDVYATVRYELGGLSFDAKFRPGNWLSFDVAVEANAPYWWFEQQVLELATETDGLPVAEVGAKGEAARESHVDEKLKDADLQRAVAEAEIVFGAPPPQTEMRAPAEIVDQGRK